jgi:hypothetical protein
VNGLNTSETVENLTSNADNATIMNFLRIGAQSSALMERLSTVKEIRDITTFKLLHALISKELKIFLNLDTKFSGKEPKDLQETSMLLLPPLAVDVDHTYFTIFYSLYYPILL